MRGTVKWFNDEKGYGFIKPDEPGVDVFVHFSEVVGKGHRTLVEDEPVEFEMGENPKTGRPAAVKVVRLTGSDAADAAG